MIKFRIAILATQYRKRNLKLLPWRTIYEYSLQFLKLGHDVKIITDHHSDSKEESKIAGVDVVHLSHIKHFPPRNSKNIAKAISEIDPDFVLWQIGPLAFFQKRLFDTLNYPIGALAAFPIYWRRELVQRLSFSEIKIEKNLLQTSLIGAFQPQTLLRKTLNSPTIKTVITTSRENTERLKKIGVLPNKLVHIPPGVNSIFIEPPSENEIKDTRKEVCKKAMLLITYFGPPLLTRGVETLLKALKVALTISPQLKNQICMLFLFRVRENEYDVQTEKITGLITLYSYHDIVKIKSSFLSINEIASHIAASDLIVLPFKHVISDFPVSVMEAMSMGKLVISTRIDGIPELLENDRGIVVNPNDFENLGKFIVYFSKNLSELNKYGKRARKYILQRPTWKDSAEKMLELFSAS